MPTKVTLDDPAAAAEAQLDVEALLEHWSACASALARGVMEQNRLARCLADVVLKNERRAKELHQIEARLNVAGFKESP